MATNPKPENPIFNNWSNTLLQWNCTYYSGSKVVQQAEVRRQYRVVLEMLKYKLKLEKWLRTIEVSCNILWLQILLYVLRENFDI